MIADGERLKTFLKEAKQRVVLCAPFIKAKVLRTILSVVPAVVPVRIITRWRATEVAAGISDLEVMQIANERPNTELRLLDDLHAKLYVADDLCLVGSANLTATALGWSKRSNIELLISAKPTDSDIALLLERLEESEPATEEVRSEVQKRAATLNVTLFDEGLEVTGDAAARRLAWLPRCAAPDKLYEIYQNSATTVVVEGTRDDGLADLRDLQVRNGLELREFNNAVRKTLLLMPAFVRIIDEVPQGITDASGIGLVENARPDLAGQDAQVQWRFIRDWIQTFFGDEFEVAPESFVIRLRAP